MPQLNTIKDIPNQPKIKVLLEMRPAFEGFAGIPQEVRLLFKGLCTLPQIKVQGLLQTSSKVLKNGYKNNFFDKNITKTKLINKFSRVVISSTDNPDKNIFIENTISYFEKKSISWILFFNLVWNAKIRLTMFDTKSFEDFIWRTLFSKTLPASDFDLITKVDYQICAIPWNTLHAVGARTLNLLNFAVYPIINTKNINIFIGQTPYPGRVLKSTIMVIRYHDALPIFMPHTISNKVQHQSHHFQALISNFKNGAYFACVSNSTRNDLLKIIPEAEKQSITIYNMVSESYFIEDNNLMRAAQVIRSRLYEGDADNNIKLVPEFFSNREKDNFYIKKINSKNLKYILMVSTIEPRKNHSRLLAAWEVIKSEIDEDLKLVIVGTLGWDFLPFIRSIKSWIDRGDVFMLNAVPSPDLRCLYRNALVTVCPSLGEGFDFSGVEAMRSGGITVASDIPVHREIYRDAAEYFNPYSTKSLVEILKKVLYNKDSVFVRQKLVAQGEIVSVQYLPEWILPQWDAFLSKLVQVKQS